MAFNLDQIEKNLCTNFLGKASVANELWDEIGSTNDRALELAKAGADEGVFVLARSQSGGRGRQGKSWISRPDSGIFMSILLRPTLPPADIPLISLAAGVAVSEALENICSIKAGLKWVNDIVINGKKLGGILAEMHGSQTASAGKILLPAVIVGIGINLTNDRESLPDDLKDKVTSVSEHSNIEPEPNAIVAEIINCLEGQYNSLLHAVPELVLEEWKRRSVTIGKHIRATAGDGNVDGEAINITNSGALILKTETGDERILHAGEISIRLSDGTYA
ncbi:MAG: biotin--[acetyl-CoA-carboxylase] ligase [Candidatus Obscuribacterales bacterium]|jgi:BirA family biotin operon repressor/biotin-[acetyl-CoA-carboxylase] ligase|nr:biotin--[acetyl-CoA-carboxylase] ligase [Candidatus Obscuribacterales bacterium]